MRADIGGVSVMVAHLPRGRARGRLFTSSGRSALLLAMGAVALLLGLGTLAHANIALQIPSLFAGR